VGDSIVYFSTSLRLVSLGKCVNVLLIVCVQQFIKIHIGHIELPLLMYVKIVIFVCEQEQVTVGDRRDANVLTNDNISKLYVDIHFQITQLRCYTNRRLSTICTLF
jgi:hypothetical protein